MHWRSNVDYKVRNVHNHEIVPFDPSAPVVIITNRQNMSSYDDPTDDEQMEDDSITKCNPATEYHPVLNGINFHTI